MDLLNYDVKKDWRADRSDYSITDNYMAECHENGVVIQRTVDVYAVSQTDGKKTLHNRTVIRIATDNEVVERLYNRTSVKTARSNKEALEMREEGSIIVGAKNLFEDVVANEDNYSIITEIDAGYEYMGADSPISVGLHGKDVSAYFSNNSDIAKICDALLGKEKIKNQELAAIVKHDQSFEKTFYGDIVSSTEDGAHC